MVVRNVVIFQDKLIPPKQCVALFVNQSKEFQLKTKLRKPRVPIMHDIDIGIAWGYFDEASQGHPPHYGFGAFLYLNLAHYIHVKYSHGRGSNNRTELVTLTTLLTTALEKGVKKMQVFGDSKLVID